MLTDEEIDDAQGQAYREMRAAGYNGSMGGFEWDRASARAAIAAHETKRGMSEEWMERTQSLLSALCELCYRGDTVAAQQADNALIAHISQPPAGMALVPAEPTQNAVNAGIQVAKRFSDDCITKNERFVMADAYAAAIKAAHAHMIAAAQKEQLK